MGVGGGEGQTLQREENVKSVCRGGALENILCLRTNQEKTPKTLEITRSR